MTRSQPADGGHRPLRVAIQQPGLPRYRVDLYARLAARLGADLVVLYDAVRPNSPTADDFGEGFAVTAVRDRHLIGGRLIWSGTQLRLVLAPEWDRVVLSWNIRYVSLPVALVLARLRRQDVTLWGHGYSAHETVARRLYRVALARLATRILLYSKEPLDRLPRRLRAKTTVVGNALFRELSEPDRPRPASSAPALHVIHVGQLRRDRRLDLAIGAIRELFDRGWDPHLTVVGDGPARDELSRVAARCGVGDRVTFRGAVYDDHELSRLYEEADVATFGTWGGLGVLDALERGIPVTLCGTQGSHPPEAAIVFEHLPQLVDSSVTAAGLADRLEVAATTGADAVARTGVRALLRQSAPEMVESFANALCPGDRADQPSLSEPETGHDPVR